METESYLRTDMAETILDNDSLDEWKETCTKLELTGQLSLTETSKSPIPFPLMTKSEYNIYNTLLDAHENVNSYAKEPIPLAILSLIALAQKEEYFNQGIEVWYSDSDPDPLVVGLNGESKWRADRYILGRWGDVLLDMPTLRKKAAEKFAAKRLSRLKEELQKMEGAIKNVFNDSESYMLGNDVNNYFSI